MPTLRSPRRPNTPNGSDSAVPDGLRIAAAFSWRLIVVAAALALVVLAVVRLSEIVVPFFVALVVSALLVPLAGWLRRHGWPKWTAILTSFVVVFAAIGGLALLVTERVQHDLPSLERRVHASIRSLQAFLGTAPFGITTHKLNTWVTDATHLVQSHAATIASGFQEAGSGAVHVLEGLFIIFFTTLFLLIDGPRIWAWVLRVFPRAARPRIDVAGRAGWRTLTSFIRVQLVVAVTDAIGIAAGAAILQIPLAVPIGVIVFLGAFVPVIGAIVAGVVAVVIALVFNGWVTALIMLGVVVFVQQLESHVLHPFLTGSAVKVHPLGVVLGVAGGTAVAGIVGAFFAVPVIATVNAMIVAAARVRSDGTPVDPADGPVEPAKAPHAPGSAQSRPDHDGRRNGDPDDQSRDGRFRRAGRLRRRITAGSSRSR